MDGEKARILNEKHPTKESADKMDPNSNDDNKIANSSKIKPKKRSSASGNDDKNDGDGPALSYTKKESIDKKIKNIENPASTSQSQIKTSHRSNFLHRLLACGGSCTGRRRTSNSTQNIKKPLNDHIGMRKPSIELSLNLKKLPLEHAINAENHETKEILNQTLAKHHSHNDLFNVAAVGNGTREDSYEYTSYESIIDKFDHSIIKSNMYNTQENFNSRSIPNSKEQNIADKSINDNQEKTKLVLPILKINDDYVNSPNLTTRKQIHASINTYESASVEEYDEDDEEMIEIGDDEDDEFEDECEDLKMLILNQSDYDDYYMMSLETDMPLKPSLANDAKIKKINQNNNASREQKKSTCVIKTDENKISESLNLVCQTSLSLESTTTPSHKSNDLNDSSNECFQHPKMHSINIDGVKSSFSNFSLKNNFEVELNDESVNSADNGANLFLPLLMARKRNKSQNSNSRFLHECNNDASFSSVSSSIVPNSKSPSPFYLVPVAMESAANSVIAPLTLVKKTVNATNTTNTNPDKSSELKGHGTENATKNPDLTNEESLDILNEISKVNNWLRDTNNNHHHNRNFKLDPSIQASPEVTLKVSNENNDSAIDMRSNCSISNKSKGSSAKLMRIRWESFSKYYRSNYQQTNSMSTTNYQISAMSLEQIMLLRKLALLQFSKLLERQHSTMHRTLRIFSKNKDVAEFQRVYDSIDSLAKSDSPKTKLNPSNGEHLNKSDENYESLIIENKKIIHQLGAPKARNKRIIKAQSSLKSTTESSFSDKRESGVEKSIVSDSTVLVKPIEKVISINTKGFTLLPSTVFGTSLNAIIQHTGQPLPNRILEAMKYIRKIAQNEVGIFRKNGVKTRINKLKESINRNESINYQSSDYTPFDIADTIKLYFRELPECLITNKLSDILLSNYDRVRPEDRKIILQQVMLLIPDENRLVLQTLLLFLNEIAKYYKINQMTRSNLAVCFSPVIFRFNLEKKSKLKQPISMNPNPNLSNSNFKTSINTLNNLKENNEEENNPMSVDRNYAVPLALEVQTNEHINDNKSELNSHPIKEISEKNDIDFLNNHTINQQIPLVSINEFAQLATSTPSTAAKIGLSQIQAAKNSNYKRKYSEKINKAASSIVNFGSELNKSNKFLSSSDSTKGSFENMSKVIQLCVSDMIKYSFELFNVPFENFQNIKHITTNSDPPSLDYYYDINTKSLNKSDFFAVNLKMDKNFWHYMDKFEDVSIYFCKEENNENKQTNDDITSVLPDLAFVNNSSSPDVQLQSVTEQIYSGSISNTIVTSTNFLTLMPQKFETFTDKLKIWKCCTLIKHKNVTLDQILNRIKYERQCWDDDFIEGKITEVLDENTELYNYSISFMPPQPPRNFYELRHLSKQSLNTNDTFILTSTSIKQNNSILSSFDIRSNMILSKYVVEKLIATDTITTFKITHYIKLDYRGFTLEFYNKAFGYMIARQLYNLKMSLKDINSLQVL